MNDYALNKELIHQVLHEILADKPTLLPVSPTCQCHFLDPNKLRMLLWKDLREGQETYILKIAEQKFVGESRADRRGEVYWKFRELYESKEVKPLETKPTEALTEVKPKPMSLYSKEELERINKFRERQVKALNAQAQKETKWIEGNEHLAQLEKEKAEKKDPTQLASVKENYANANPSAN